MDESREMLYVCGGGLHSINGRYSPSHRTYNGKLLFKQADGGSASIWYGNNAWNIYNSDGKDGMVEGVVGAACNDDPSRVRLHRSIKRSQPP